MYKMKISCLPSSQLKFAKEYFVTVEFDEVEKEIGYVDSDKYSFFNLMNDCHKRFDIRSDFVQVIISQSIMLRCDDHFS